LQGRYKHLTEKEIQEIQRETDLLWSDLQAKAARERL